MERVREKGGRTGGKDGERERENRGGREEERGRRRERRETERELKPKKANCSPLSRNTVSANPQASGQLGGKIQSTIACHPLPPARDFCG